MKCANCGKAMDEKGMECLGATLAIWAPLCWKCIDGINSGAVIPIDELPATDPTLAALGRAFDDALDLAYLG